MWSAVGRKTAKHRIQRWIYQFLYTITDNKISHIYGCLQRFSNRKKTKYVRTLTFPLPNHLHGYRREWYRKYTKIKFEGHDFQVQANYKNWLLWEFGDYMELPPACKRKVHPVTEIDFPTEMIFEK